MDSQNEITTLLFLISVVLVFILIVLLIVLGVLRLREKQKKKQPVGEVGKGQEKDKRSSETTSYNKQSIFDFMEFDGVEDNMIVQKKGKRYIMAIECQGVNYDLMSKIEKVSVEEGFQQFLNTLRHPIQIYIQTRTINLEKSIQTYKERVKVIEDQYNHMVFEYNRRMTSGVYSQEQLDADYFELTKQRNLLEYAKDIINNTEKMSLNRSVLSKRYYLILSYVPEEAGNDTYDVEELRNIAFSELYTKSQALIRTLSASSVSGKILTSRELIDLLYVAYNRDESEIYSVNRALNAGFEDLYSTAPDIFEKKIRMLDEVAKEKAIDLANEKIQKIKSKPQQMAEQKEKELDDLISQMAEIILQENKEYVGEEVATRAIEEIKNERSQTTMDEGGKVDEKTKKTTKGRTRKNS